MSDIFVSYASSDRERARVLAQALESQGWSVWWDRNIQLGHDFDLVIEEALDGARCVIVVWTVDSVRSSWVRSEADDAKQRGVLLPVFFDDVRAPLAFRRIQSTFLVDWDGDVEDPAFQGLSRAVAAMVCGAAAAPPPVTREEIEPEAPASPPVPEPQAPEPGPVPAFDLPAAAIPHDEPTAPLSPPRTDWRLRLAVGAIVLLAVGWGASVLLKPPSPTVGERLAISPPPDDVTQAPPPPPPKLDPETPSPSPASEEVTTPPPPSPPPEIVPPSSMASSPAVKVRPPSLPSHHSGTLFHDDALGMSFRYVQARGHLGHDFWIGQTEITHGDWKRITGDDAPAFYYDRTDPELPMEWVTWYQTLQFANHTSATAGLQPCYRIDGSNVGFTGVTCAGYRIPTEDEWEYAARAGSGSRFCFGNTLSSDHANFGDRALTEKVASFKANRWGLFDVHGNVWEWTWEKVARGGGYDSRETDCQLTARQQRDPGYRERNLGFRLVRTAR